VVDGVVEEREASGGHTEIIRVASQQVSESAGQRVSGSAS
jgi:hypothetical protein